MNIEIINTGSELMLGFVLNTHQQWLCRRLADSGYEVSRQVAIADEGRAIQQAVREALGRADVIIVTGGIGPTSDDLTRELIAELLGKKLLVDKIVLAGIEKFFADRRVAMPAGNDRQAHVPEGALVLVNPNGTAPGLAMKVNPNAFRADGKVSWLFMLPGPPRELRPMFDAHVLPLIQREFPPESAFICRTLRTAGLGESALAEKIAGPLEPFVARGLEIGYCAHSGAVDVRLVARGDVAKSIVDDAESIVREKLGKHIYGTGTEELNEVIVRLLTERGKTLAVAESCTGGYIASSITDVPGASEVFLFGAVTYSNEAKKSVLGVSAETLAQHGAVSQQTAFEMANGALKVSGADYAIATTGIAGPSGGTPEKPVGKVYIALAAPGEHETVVIQAVNRYDRPTFKLVTCRQALEGLRRILVRG